MSQAGEHKLFVGGLPSDVTEEDLQVVFGTYGTILKIHILDKVSSQNGLKAGFVIYEEKTSCEDAIKVLDNVYKIRHHAEQPLRVRWAHSTRDESKGSKAENAYSTDGYKVFVGDLPTDCTQPEIEQLFGACGKVNKVHLMAVQPGSNQRCALVFYEEQRAAEEAIEVLDNQYKFREDAEKPIVVRFGSSNRQGQDKDGKGKGKIGTSCKDDPWAKSVYSDPWSSGYEDKGKGKIYNDKGKGKHWDDGWNQDWLDSGWYGGGSSCGWDSWQGGNSSWGDGNAWWQSGGGKEWSKDHGGKGRGGGKYDSGKGGYDSGKEGKGGKDDKESKAARNESGTKLFVGNLPGDIGNAAVEYVFKTYGKVTNVNFLPKPSESSSLAGFVEYETPDEAATAISYLHGKYEMRKGCGKLQVKYANAPRKDRSAPY